MTVLPKKTPKFVLKELLLFIMIRNDSHLLQVILGQNEPKGLFGIQSLQSYPDGTEYEHGKQCKYL